MPPTKSKRESPKTLTVPDEIFEDVFVENARQVWRQAHPGIRKRRGRPTNELNQVMEACIFLQDHGRLNRQTSQGKTYGLVKSWLDERTVKPLAPNTILKWVKEWRKIQAKITLHPKTS
jgi:hypothetical protein